MAKRSAEDAQSRISKRTRLDTNSTDSPADFTAPDSQNNNEESAGFEILTGYRDLDQKSSKDRVEVARNGDVGLVIDRLKLADRLFERFTEAEAKNTSLLAHDSRALLGVSELAQLSVRNLKLDAAQLALGVNDAINYTKRYMLKDYFKVNGIPEPQTDILSHNEDEGQQNEDDEVNHDLQAHSRQKAQRNLLDAYGRYNEFTHFNWFKLGMLFQAKSRAPAVVDHLLGPFAAEKKVRASSQRAARSIEVVGRTATAARVTRDSLIESEKDESTPENVKKCFKILRKQKGHSPINLYKFIIDPNSFARSVENLFYTSFLIKEGKLVMDEDEEGFPAVRVKEPLPSGVHDREIEVQKRKDTRPSHLIFQLDINTWRKLIDRFDIRRSFLGAQGKPGGRA
ncbi:LADA_0C02146g1_1 [Lachancea dasiensis]|uniref:Non-structural maintenance of chromosomes element 4 n=1 Tax=Lachancea dasiensis TaxID=1072105 RepID=A0A1G4IXZ6_9SACH|nr:LADA_0C02146g1_1 [Lachancea dasiensis]